jgi:hypothetical protein
MLTEQEIGDHLYDLYSENFQRPLVSLSRKVSPEHLEILITLSKARVKARDRANTYYGKHFDLDLWQLWDLWVEQKGLCAVTKMPMNCEVGECSFKNPWKVSIDRIDSEQGYVIDNVRLVTHWYNNAKNSWDDSVPLEALEAWVAARASA